MKAWNIPQQPKESDQDSPYGSNYYDSVEDWSLFGKWLDACFMYDVIVIA